MNQSTPVNLIGRGRIGAAVADWIAASGHYRLRAAIGRDTQAWPPAPLTIDTAGPGVLRAFGASVLAQGDLWTVGASALLDGDLRAALQAVALRHGTRLRLFTGWISGPALCPPGVPARLHVSQSAPGLGGVRGLLFRGPLSEAAARFPDHLNTATAAALTGPGIAATTVALHGGDADAPHLIRARFAMPGQVIRTEVRFGDGPHPVAQAIIAALAAREGWLRL